jgi:hypothetical protein
VTVAEAWYGTKRVKVEAITESSVSSALSNNDTINHHQKQHRRLRPITKRDGIRLALFMTVGPYLEKRSDLLRQNMDGTTFHSVLFLNKDKQRLRNFVQLVWPVIRLITKLVVSMLVGRFSLIHILPT